MSRHQTLSIIATMIGTYVVSLIVMIRGQHGHVVPSLEMNTTPAPMPRPLERPNPAIAPAIAPLPSIAPAPAPAAPLDEAPALPVSVQVMYRHRINSIIANVSNISGDALSIQASVVRNGSQVSGLQIDLPPYGTQSFGMADGVDMQSGDQVVLHSADFRERSQTVP